MTEKEKLKDIAVIGDRELCLGFRLAGVEETHVVDEDEFEDTFNDLMDRDLGILITHQDLLHTLNRKRREQVNDSVEPVVVALSEEGESSDLRAKIKQAIGVDIWS
ncbi:MAG: V-type ATP synthase subunit F [Candidatus Nanohaloarchaea archaeon]|nr:V-type ATP synthase subunit F [Candidatus Nanohaloarchaea archaeon]